MLNPEKFCTVLVYFPTNGLVLQTNVMSTLYAPLFLEAISSCSKLINYMIVPLNKFYLIFISLLAHACCLLEKSFSSEEYNKNLKHQYKLI